MKAEPRLRLKQEPCRLIESVLGSYMKAEPRLRLKLSRIENWLADESYMKAEPRLRLKHESFVKVFRKAEVT